MRRCVRDDDWALPSDSRVRSSAEVVMKDLYQVLRIRAAIRRTPDKKPTPKRSDVRMLSAMCFKFWWRVCFLFPVQSHGWNFRTGVSSDHSGPALHQLELRARPLELRARPRLPLLASPQVHVSRLLSPPLRCGLVFWLGPARGRQLGRAVSTP